MKKKDKFKKIEKVFKEYNEWKKTLSKFYEQYNPVNEEKYKKIILEIKNFYRNYQKINKIKYSTHLKTKEVIIKDHISQNEWKDIIEKIFESCIYLKKTRIDNLGRRGMANEIDLLRFPFKEGKSTKTSLNMEKRMKLYLALSNSFNKSNSFDDIAKNVNDTNFNGNENFLVFEIDQNKKIQDSLTLLTNNNQRSKCFFVYQFILEVDGIFYPSDPISTISTSHFYRGKGEFTVEIIDPKDGNKKTIIKNTKKGEKIENNEESIIQHVNKKHKQEKHESKPELVTAYELYKNGESNKILRYLGMYNEKSHKLNHDISIMINFYDCNISNEEKNYNENLNIIDKSISEKSLDMTEIEKILQENYLLQGNTTLPQVNFPIPSQIFNQTNIPISSQNSTMLTNPIPYQNLNLMDVSFLSQNLNQINSIPPQNSNILNSIPSQNSNILNSIPSQNLNILNSIPSQNSNTLNPIPPQNSNILNSIPSQNSNTLNSIPSQNSNTLNSILSQKFKYTKFNSISKFKYTKSNSTSKSKSNKFNSTSKSKSNK